MSFAASGNAGDATALLHGMRWPDVRPDRDIVLSPALGPNEVFRHSVVPGGVRTAQDVRRAMDRDAVVATHYANVTPGALRVERLAADQMAHVSYRIGDTIYWTKAKVRIPKGETILTDGVTQIRARCGNCIAFDAMLPTTDEEPAAMEFDNLIGDDSVPTYVPLWGAVFGGPGEVTGGLLLPDPESSEVPSSSIGFIPVSGFGIGGTISGREIFPGDSFPEDSPVSDLPLENVDPGGSAGTGTGDPNVPFVPENVPSAPKDRSTGKDGGSPVDPSGPNGPPAVTPPGFAGPPPAGETPAVPVPEPATLLLLGGGLAKLIHWRTRTRARRV